MTFPFLLVMGNTESNVTSGVKKQADAIELVAVLAQVVKAKPVKMDLVEKKIAVDAEIEGMLGTGLDTHDLPAGLWNAVRNMK